MATKTGIQAAVDKLGTPSKLAAATNGKILRQHIEHWLKAGQVPVEKCPVVATASGVSCERLNPGFDWASLRQAVEMKAA